MENKKSFKT